MNAEERERQRVQKLREQQIRSRDPGPSKIRHYDWSRQRQRRSPLLDVVFGVPTRLRGLALGLLFGIGLAALMSVVEPRLEILGVLLIPVTAVVGWVIGIVIQSQE